jgi:hypothetical protein
MMMTSTRAGKPVPSHLRGDSTAHSCSHLHPAAREATQASRRALSRVVCVPRCVSAQARCTTSARRW